VKSSADSRGEGKGGRGKRGKRGKRGRGKGIRKGREREKGKEGR
jgi:hypothetical protein